jgi:hypothetical protein
MKIKCYVNWAYIFTGIVAKLQEQGLVIESVYENPRRGGTVIGTIEPEKIGNLWKVAGLHIYEVLKWKSM